jgi:hypothetical protein
MKRILLIGTLLLLILLPHRALAQTDEPPVRLRLRRNFGYGGGSQIQGTFTMRASSEEPLSKVEFLIDGEVVFSDESPPFEYRFNTGDYAEGSHTMTAIGYTSAGSALPTNSYQREFLSSEDAWSAASGLVGPLILIVLGLTVVSTVVPVLLGRRRIHKPGVYGAAGGAICPRCTFPYSRNFLSPNLLAGKLESCPHCGKWAIVRRALPADLEAAEKRLAAEGEPEIASTETEEERLRRLLDESRFES